MRALSKPPARSQSCWKRCRANLRRRSRAICVFQRSVSARDRIATGRFWLFTICWDSRSTRHPSSRVNMPTWEKSFRRRCVNTARMCAAADSLPTPSRITRPTQARAARQSQSPVDRLPRLRIEQEQKMTPDEMRSLYDYNAWANHRSMDAASKLSAEQFVRPMGSSFGSVRDTLAHIYGAEWIWLERFEGRSPSSLPDTIQFRDIASLRKLWSEHEAHLLSFVRGLTQTDLDRVFEYKTLKFGVYRNPLWQSMQHLANHGSYHRGQVTTLLRQLGAQPILTDLMHFYRERAAAAGV